MTLYAIVAIVLSLSGATFTAINQLSTLLNKRIDEMRRESEDRLKFIAEQLKETGQQKSKAKKRDKKIKTWCRIWDSAGFPPLGVLAIFAFIAAGIVMYNMPNGSATPLSPSAVSFYRWSLGIVAVINVISLILKVCAWRKIKRYANEQEQCYQTIAETNPVGQPITPEPPNGSQKPA